MQPSTFAKGNKRTRGNIKTLRMEAHADKAPRVALRIQGIMLSLEKHSVSDIAQLLQVHRLCPLVDTELEYTWQRRIVRGAS